MHNEQNTRKIVSAGTLIGRAFFICLAFLIIPLLVHSFFQYRKELTLEKQEIYLQEMGIRATLRAIGEQISQRIEDFIYLDWAVLNREDPSLEELFDCKEIVIEKGNETQFVWLDKEQDELVVGKRTSSTQATVMIHSLSELFTLKSPPFPIVIGLNEDLHERWIETISIPNTDLTLSLGTQYTGITHFHKQAFVLRIFSFLMFVGLMGGGLVYLLLSKLARPLNVLRLTMSRVAEGAVYSRYVPQRFGFEINTIGQYFNETLDALLAYQQKAESEKVEKERFAEKFQLAQEIQLDLLPKKIPTASHIDIGALYLPALEVSGDFYDIFPLSKGGILFVVADVADKGISACLFSLGLRSSLRALAEASGQDLSKIVEKANELFLVDAEETGQFATVWMGILDGKSLSYMSLGHPPALLKRAGELTELSTKHPAMGLGPFESTTSSLIQLQNGDELLIFSDGVTEAHDRDQQLFGIERLKEKFLRKSDVGAEVALKSLAQDLEAFTRGATQHDDITALLLRL